MHPVNFKGAIEIKKPANMTDEECMSVWAKYGLDTLLQIFLIDGLGTIPPGVFTGIDNSEFPFFITAWKPNKEDIDAINRGEPIYIKTLAVQLPPMAVFTIDENGEGNF